MNNLISGEDILNKLGIPFERKGDQLVCLCPLHNEKTPSFFMDSSTTQYNCFGCGNTGNWITLVRELTGQNPYKFIGISSEKKEDYLFNRTLNLFKENRSKILKVSSKEPNLKIVGNIIHPYDNKESKIYCGKRNISLDDIDKYNIFYLKDGYIGLTEFNTRLVIPIKDRNESIVGYEGRDIIGQQKKKCIYPYQSKIGSTLFDLHNLDYSIPTIFVEGILDILQVKKACPEYQVTTYFGIQYTKIQAEIIKQFNSIIAMFDSDDGGYRGYYLLEELKSFIVAYIKHDDPSENTYKEIQIAVKNQIPFSRFKQYLEGVLISDVEEW